MRAIICTRHNMLMEARSSRSSYVLCEACVVERKEPSWFPIALAMRNHQDGETKRTWVAEFNRFTRSGWTWKRIKKEGNK